MEASNIRTPASIVKVACGICDDPIEIDVTQMITSYAEFETFSSYCESKKHRAYLIRNKLTGNYAVISLPSGVRSNIYFVDGKELP